MMENWNENKYLVSGDYSKFDREKLWFEYSKAVTVLCYHDLVDKYNEFVSLAGDFVNNFKIENDSIKKSILLRNLIYSGIFSVNNKYKYNNVLKFECDSLGANVVLGYGCCRNATAFHKDIFDNIGDYIDTFTCYLDFKEKPLKKTQNKEVNHVISLLKDNDNNLVGFDITNNFFCKFNSAYQMVPLKGSQGYNLTYKPYYEYVMYDRKIDEINELVKIYDEESKKTSSLTTGQVYDKYIEVEDLIEDNSDLIDKFKKDTKSLKKDILVLSRKK